LLSDYKLYNDIFYNHTPGSAWLFHGITNGFGTDHLLLAARLGVFAGWAIFGISLIVVTFKLTRSPAMAGLAVLLIMANEALLNQTGMTATNNLLPLAAAYLGLGLFLLGVANGQTRPALIASSGLALSIAAVFKANAFVFIPVVAIASLLLPREAMLVQRLKRVVAPLAVGGTIGALPVLIYLIADPNRFLAHVIGFHTGPHVAYWAAQTASSDEVVAMTAGSKALFAYGIWFSGANLVFIFLAIFLTTCLVMSEPAKRAAYRIFSGRMVLVLASFLAAICMSFVPTPGFPQYYTLPLVCAPLVLAFLYAELDTTGKQQAQPGLIAASLVILLVGLPQLVQYVPRLAYPSRWTVERVHNAGTKIAQQMLKGGVSGKIATLAPIYAIEGGLDVYPEFATGQFAYRTAEFADSSLRQYYRTTSPSEVGAFLMADPPAAILVGFEPKLEAPLIKFAEQNGYRRIDNLDITDRYGKAVLYLRPSATPLN
jgi:hypothetical protein